MVEEAVRKLQARGREKVRGSMKTTLLWAGLGALLVLVAVASYGRQPQGPPAAATPRPRDQDRRAATPEKRETAKVPSDSRDMVALARRVEKLEQRVVELKARKEELLQV